MANRIKRSFAGSFPTKHNAREQKVLETAQNSWRKDVWEEFRERPTFVDDDGDGAPTGATGDVNIMRTVRHAFEYCILGAGQTIVKPVWSATTGLDIGLDQADDEGVEITNGISARSLQAFTVGTDPAFYAELTITVEDVSGTDDLCWGFRKAEAYQTAVDAYDEGAWLNINAGDIKAETILNNATTVTSGTLASLANTGTVTLRVEVGQDRLVRWFIDGTEYTSPTQFRFDSGEVVVPFLYFLNAADVAGAVTITKWRVGSV